MRLRRVTGRLLLVLLGTVAGLGLGELGLRALGFEEELARRRTVFDPKYGTVKEDSWIFDFEVDPQAERVSLRGQTVPVDPEPGETRVLFVGDSGTEGVRVPLQDTYPLRFQRILDEEKPGHAVRAINAGVFGMTTIDELHFLRDKLLALDPDVVVLGLFMSNDINFNLGHVERLRKVHPRSSWGKSLVRKSALARFVHLQAVALNARYQWFGREDLAEESLVPRDVALVDSYGFHMLSYPEGEVATYMKEPSRLVEHAFDVLERVLWKMDELGDEKGFDFRVLVLPSPSAVAGRLTLLHYPDIRERLRNKGIHVKSSELDVGAPTRRVLSICDELEIPCIDPTSRMREEGMKVFFDNDEHFTDTGHAVLARELVEHYDRLMPK